MPLARLVTGALALAFVGALPLPLALPAHAAGVVETAIDAEISDSRLVWRERFTIRGSVVDVATEAPVAHDTYDGRVLLEWRRAGEEAWAVLAEAPDERSFEFPDLVARQNATYRLRYTGGTSTDLTTQRPSEASADVRVARRLPHRGVEPREGVFRLEGRVRPDWRRKPVLIQRKACRTCAWKRWDTVTTDRKGRFSVRIRARRTAGTVVYRPVVRRTADYVRTTGSGVSLTTS